MELGFTDIKEIVNALIEWLKQFFQAVEDMFAGITYTYAGYKTEEETTEANKPL